MLVLSSEGVLLFFDSSIFISVLLGDEFSIEDNSFCKLILLDKDSLVGFISLFPNDGEEEKDLTPWYATMYVKKEYRNQGCSKILHNAILSEAKNRGFTTLYLKTDLNNYYEKFGAIFIKRLNSGEKLYKIELK